MFRLCCTAGVGLYEVETASSACSVRENSGAHESVRRINVTVCRRRGTVGAGQMSRIGDLPINRRQPNYCRWVRLLRARIITGYKKSKC